MLTPELYLGESDSKSGGGAAAEEVAEGDESSHNIQWTQSAFDPEEVKEPAAEAETGEEEKTQGTALPPLADIATIPFNYPVLAKQGDNLASGRRGKTFSMSLLSALCEDGALANLLVEGSVDQSVFEHFLYHTLNQLARSTTTSQSRPVVVYLDNATIHKTSLV